MSFREKTAWISLISMAGIYGLYFWSAVRSRAQGGSGNLTGLAGTVVAIVVVQTVLTIIVAIFDPKDAQAPRDERDRMIDLKSARFAYFALAGSVACAVSVAAIYPSFIFSTNALLFVLVAAEVLRSGCQIVQYRRGA